MPGPARRREAPRAPPGRARTSGERPRHLASEQEAERRDQSHEGEAAGHIVVLHMAQLVGHDRVQLAAGRVLDQVVVEDDPLGRSDPVDIGVQRGHAAAGVDAVHLADVDPGPPTQLEHVSPDRAALLERLEPVEEGRQDHGGKPGEDGGQDGDPDAARNPPTAREAPHERDQQGTPAGREDGTDRRRLGRVAQPGADVLGGDAVVDRTLVRGDPDRQCGDGQGHGQPGAGEGGASHRPRTQPLQDTAGRRRAAQGEGYEHRALGSEAGEHQPELTPGVVLAPLDLGGGEVVVLRDLRRVDRVLARAQQPDRRLGDHDHRHGRGADPPEGATPPHLHTIGGRRLRLAILSDIHANLPALEAVLADIDGGSAEELWCLGDVVGYGAQPDECARLVADRCALCLAGNHDLAVLGELDIDSFSPAAAEAVRWTARVAEGTTLEFLRGLEPADETRDVALYHASPRDPVWEYVLWPDQAAECIEVQAARVAMIGHSHVALFFATSDDGDARAGSAPAAVAPARGSQAGDGATLDLAEGRWLINPGSVGQPRDGDPRGAWLELDTGSWTATYHRVEYEIDRAAEAITAADLPEHLAQRLYVGQ